MARHGISFVIPGLPLDVGFSRGTAGGGSGPGGGGPPAGEARQFMTPAGMLNTTAARQYMIPGEFVNEV